MGQALGGRPEKVANPPTATLGLFLLRGRETVGGHA